jgi:hypothetical protein
MEVSRLPYPAFSMVARLTKKLQTHVPRPHPCSLRDRDGRVHAHAVSAPRLASPLALAREALLPPNPV